MIFMYNSRISMSQCSQKFNIIHLSWICTYHQLDLDHLFTIYADWQNKLFYLNNLYLDVNMNTEHVALILKSGVGGGGKPGQKNI